MLNGHLSVVLSHVAESATLGRFNLNMSRNSFGKRRLQRTALAVGLSLGLGLVSSVAMAQSNTSGTVFGEAQAGSTVVIQNVDTGLKRTVQVGESGRYRAPPLQVGTYSVTLERNGEQIATRDNVRVTIGNGVEVSFGGGTDAQALEGVSVTASALPQIDVSSVDSRTVMTAEMLQKLPVAQNVNAAVMLAPGTVGGDSRFGNVVSMGGSSGAENQYYINGFPVTNALNGMGFTTLPFDAIGQQQVYYGGYGAEYGRSTGGVVNIISKRGGNTWKAGAEVNYTPNGLRANRRSTYWKDGQLVSDRSRFDNPWETRYGAYISGPLVKDKLFMYISGEATRSEEATNSGTSADARHTTYEDRSTRWFAKIDWNITDSHILEFTGIGDQSQSDRATYVYDYPQNQVLDEIGTLRAKNYDGQSGANPGGNIYIGKYTGYITDDLTISALYGKTHTDHLYSPRGISGDSCPQIVDSRASVPLNQRLAGCDQGLGMVLADGAYDESKGWRLDIEYQLGSHQLRAGLDTLKVEAYSGQEREGGGTAWVYYDTPADRELRGGAVTVPAGYKYYVNKNTFRAAANVRVDQEAQYIEDHWQISDSWLAYIGLRNEQFKNYNGDGQVYSKQRHQLAPRLGLSWDVFGDSSFKIYANAGRYHLAIPASTAIRGASGQYYAVQYGVFDSIADNGVPVNFQPIENPVYQNGADGTAPDPKSVSARDLGAYYQDEYILGFDKAIGSDWSFGAKFTYRNLKQIIDDFCDGRPFANWADANGVDWRKGLGENAEGKPQDACFMFNPGKGATFLIDLDGDGQYETVKLSAEDMGFPEAKRSYYALNLYLEHQFADDWYGRVDYTFSRSYGNTEGMLKSDIGQDDIAATQDWDFPELMNGANGPEANDRTHQLRFRGFYQITPEWLVSANALVMSGRPKNCIGNYPGTPPTTSDYGASFFYCGGELSPRGSKGRLPWTYRLDLGAEYRPAFADHKLAFTADVFNVFNQQRMSSMQEVGELDGGDHNPAYGSALSFASPRYVRFGVRYDF